MTSLADQLPVYRAMTVVSTALSHDGEGELAHILVVSTTLPEEVEVVYDLRPARKAK
ncbi:MAG TPA: hypothetical protein VHL57_06760 [Flavobacteriales bacterium]|jgi:hypothetical protein|nr:hypothetical protein [Flavobacteriales bacterium]